MNNERAKRFVPNQKDKDEVQISIFTHSVYSKMI